MRLTPEQEIRFRRIRDELMNNCPSHFRNFRQDLAMAQMDFAHLIEIEPSTQSRAEAGKYLPSFKTVASISALSIIITGAPPPLISSPGRRIRSAGKIAPSFTMPKYILGRRRRG